MSLEEEKARVEKEKRGQEEKEGKANLDGIKEEDESAQPLLDKNGEPSGSGGGSSTDDKKPNDDGDKMDTA